MRSVQKVSSHALWKNRDIYWRRYKIQETLYIGQWYLSPLQCSHLGTLHSSPSLHHLPLVFSWISSTVWNIFLFKVISVLGKARSFRVPNLGCWGVESPGRFDVSQKKNPSPNVRHEWAHYCGEAANHQLPIAMTFWIIRIVSMEECSRTQNLIQICCSTHSVILNAMATQYISSLNSVYCLHWLV